VHIPKTAGATVTSMFIAAYSEAEVLGAGNYLRHPEQAEAEIARARWSGGWTDAALVGGHVPYGLFCGSLPRDTRYMTFLREPVDRVLSHYHRHLQRKSPTSDSLVEALERGMPELNNLATRFLCGSPSPSGKLESSALDDAKASLSAFAFVGIQERFEESVVLLQRILGLDLVPYLNLHVSTERPLVEEIPEAQRALIEEHNRLDAELYAFALELFEGAVTAADEGFAADVARLRALSRDTNQEAIQKARDWLEGELSSGTSRPIATLYAAAEAAGVAVPALKHVIARSPVRKVKDRDGQKVLTRSDGAP
jgi:hypothetical protein